MEVKANCIVCGDNIYHEPSHKCSSLGAATFNYCYACLWAGAEPIDLIKEIVGDPEDSAEWVIYWDKDTDWYVQYSTGKVLEPAKLKTGEAEFSTKKEFNEYLNKKL